MDSKLAQQGSHVLLVVCGGIAAYKAAEVLRLLQKAACEVRVVATEDSLNFVGPSTWEGLTHEQPVTSLYGWPHSTIPHVYLAGWADAVLVVPATANVMAKMCTGLADDAVSATLLAIPQETPVFVAPAMNVHMWKAPATQANVQTLVSRGIHMVLPVEGRLACDCVGEGKLAPVEVIADAVLGMLARVDAPSMAGRRVLITAGPTHEAIDPVRYIANASSGKMGYALAAEAARRGAEVVLVSGPVSLDAPRGVERIDVVSAAQMHDAVMDRATECDVVICAAAVADYTPAHPADHKLKKSKEYLESIDLVETADILGEVCAGRVGGQPAVVVGFAAETTDLMDNARAKFAHKGCDLLVANDVTRSDSGFGTDTNHVTLISRVRTQELPTMSKHDVAAAILDEVEVLFAGGIA